MLDERLSSALAAARAAVGRWLRAAAARRQAAGPRPGAAGRAFAVAHRGVRFDVYRLEPAEALALRLHWKRPDGRPWARLGTLRDGLAARGLELLFAVNGGIFSRARTPLGLHVEDGVPLSPLNVGGGAGNFFIRPNGVFLVTGAGARVVETDAYRPSPPARLAIQSGPILVAGGAISPRLIPGCGSRRVRNGVGVDREGGVAFAISDGVTNFHDLATLFRDRLGCPDALYLDGEVSRMYLPGLGRPIAWELCPVVSIIGLSKDRPPC